MAHCLALVEDHLKKLDEWVVKRVPRKENLKADTLAEIAVILHIRKTVMLLV